MNETLIVCDPEVMAGKPVVAGSRITVELILEKLGSGEPIEQLLESHPRLTREGVLAALRFAAGALRADVVYPVGIKSAELARRDAELEANPGIALSWEQIRESVETNP